MTRFNLALLSDDTPAEAEVDTNEAVMAEVADGPEADMAAMEEVSGDLASAEAAVDEGADSAETLEAVADKVDEANKDGGLTAPAAEALRLCVEHIATRNGLGISAKKFAVEGFQSKTTRVRSGQLASEDIKDMAKSLWAMILKAYEKVKEFVLKWFNNFFDGATKVKNRAEKLKKAAESKKDSGAVVDSKDAKIINPAYAQHLTIGGAVASASAIAGAIIEKKSDAKTMAEYIESTYTLAGELIGFTADGTKFAEELKRVVKTLAEFGKPYTGKNAKAPEGMEARQDVESVLGDVITIAYVPKTIDESTLSKIKFKMGRDSSTLSIINMDMTAANPAEVVDIATNLIKRAEELIEQKGDIKKFQKAFDSINAAFKRASSESKDEAKDRVKKAAKVARGILSMTTTGYVQARSANLMVCNAALNYGAASLKLAKAA